MLDIRTFAQESEWAYHDEPGRRARVHAQGEIDAATVEEFSSVLDQIDTDSTSIVIDLRDVTLLTASGVGAIAGLLSRLNNGESTAKVTIEASPIVAHVLSICEFEHLLAS